MAARQVAGDGQAEADAAGRRVARAFQPQERLEDLLALAGRDAWPVIVDRHLDNVAEPSCVHHHTTCEAQGVFDEISEAAYDRARTYRQP